MNSPHISRIRMFAAAIALSIVASACGSTATTTTAEEVIEETTAVVEESTTDTEAPEEAMEEAEAPEEAMEEADAEPAASGDELDTRTAVLQAAQWADNVEISIDGATVSFSSDGLPSHEYLDAYLADGRDGKYIAGGVESYNASFNFPVVPTVASSPTDAPTGAIGVSISGAVFFNPFEGDGSGTVANDDNSTIDGIPFIDACGGHPLPNASQYHYHGIPFCVTDAIDTPGEHSMIIGYLFDGYAIYGPQDVDGNEPTDLDACMGHVGPTPEFEEDTYHYHVSAEANYISACFTGEATTNGGGGRGR